MEKEKLNELASDIYLNMNYMGVNYKDGLTGNYLLDKERIERLSLIDDEICLLIEIIKTMGNYEEIVLKFYDLSPSVKEFLNILKTDLAQMQNVYKYEFRCLFEIRNLSVSKQIVAKNNYIKKESPTEPPSGKVNNTGNHDAGLYWGMLGICFLGLFILFSGIWMVAQAIVLVDSELFNFMFFIIGIISIVISHFIARSASN